jgi:hypothetical protein
VIGAAEPAPAPLLPRCCTLEGPRQGRLAERGSLESVLSFRPPPRPMIPISELAARKCRVRGRSLIFGLFWGKSVGIAD